MVDISGIVFPYCFEQGLRMLERGYEAARDALLEEVRNIEKEFRAYEDAVALNKSAWIGERDDEGYPLWEQSEIFELKISETYKVISEIRKSFVISIYHHWERCATDWRGSSPASHKKLVENRAEKGYRPCLEIDAVHYLANHLKHGPNSRTNWLERLENNFPAFLSQPAQELLELSETDITKVRRTLFEAGPYRT